MLQQHSLRLVFLMICLLPLKAFAIDEHWESAKAVVADATERMIVLMEDPALYEEAMFDTLKDKVAEIVSPVIDFNGFSRGVMGRYVREASPEEIERLSTIMQAVLVRTYALSVSDFSVSGYSIQTPRASSPRPDLQIVDVLLEESSGETYKIAYYMRRTDNVWKLVNVAVEGVNLRLTLQNQFADLYQSSRSISATIEGWERDLLQVVSELEE